MPKRLRRQTRMRCAIAKTKFLAITPHPGEMARLLNSSTKDVPARPREDRAETLRAAGMRTVILKGSHTIIARA